METKPNAEGVSSKKIAIREKKSVATQTPAELISLAITHGSDLEKLKGLLELKERFEAGEARKAYNEAMAQFKADPPKIDKDKSVGYEGKQGGRVGYKHASLYNVTQKIGTALSKYGLSAQWNTSQAGDEISVACTIKHRLGHSETTSLTAKADLSGSKNPIQAIGSTVTYLERYTILALTGLATVEQDDDGQASVTDYIDDKELNQIVDMIAESEANLDKFLGFMKIEALDKMKKSDFGKAMDALQSTLQAKRKAK